jgi:bacterioferritin-associated ferredoxin
LPEFLSFEHTVNQKDRAQGGKMYVCICNAFTERQVSIAIHTGVSSPAGVFRHLGCAPQCGKCVPTVRCMVKNSDNLLVEPKHRHHQNQYAELQTAG